MKKRASKKMNKETLPQDILGFLDTARTIVNQLQLLKNLDITLEQRSITVNAARQLVDTTNAYIGGNGT